MLAYCSRSDVVDLVADTQLCEEDSDLINQAGRTESLALQSVSVANFPPTVPGTLTARNLFTLVTFWSSMLFLFQLQLRVPEKVILFVGVHGGWTHCGGPSAPSPWSQRKVHMCLLHNCADPAFKILDIV